jgi:Ser/Thr protein kinase RdoA (MazF antagonist)
MPSHDFVVQLLHTIYDLHPTTITSLDQYQFDWRGLCRITTSDGQAWVLRVLQHQDAYRSMSDTASILIWLADRYYPAPRMCLTTSGALVGQFDGWCCLLLSFVDGATIASEPDQLHALAGALGRLHTLPLADPFRLPISRLHPDHIQRTTLVQFQRRVQSVPVRFRPLAEALYEAAKQVQQLLQGICLLHGDCWYRNAVQTASPAVVLIDWDCAGTGLALLDVGYLLLTSHYDLTHPLSVHADEQKIRALLDGYQDYRKITLEEQAFLISAIRFALAVQFGEYIDQDDPLQEDDFVLQKFQARFDATAEIAQGARRACGRQ